MTSCPHNDLVTTYMGQAHRAAGCCELMLGGPPDGRERMIEHEGYSVEVLIDNLTVGLNVLGGFAAEVALKALLVAVGSDIVGSLRTHNLHVLYQALPQEHRRTLRSKYKKVRRGRPDELPIPTLDNFLRRHAETFDAWRYLEPNKSADNWGKDLWVWNDIVGFCSDIVQALPCSQCDPR